MRLLLFLLLGIAAFVALLVRTYTAPPAPDRRGGTTIMVTWPNRTVFGSPRADCVGRPEAEPVIGCLVASLAKARSDGFARLEIPFCARCYDVSQRIAVLGLDEKAVRAKQDQMARFGW